MIYLKDSFYWKKVKENFLLIFFSFFVSVGCVLISYPGIFYSDSYGRVWIADELRTSIKLLLTGQADLMETTECWFSVVPSFLMAICRGFTGNLATYTLAQSFSFFLVTFLLIKKLSPKYKWLQYILVLINPLFYGEAIYYEGGVGCVVGIGVLVLLLTSHREKNCWADNIIEIVLLIFASFVTFGYRSNAFTIIPAIVGFIILQKRNNIKKLVAIGAITLGLIAVLMLPKVLKVDTMGSPMAGFVWDMLTAIQFMPDQQQVDYLYYLDELASEGATLNALRKNYDYIVLGYMESEINAKALSAEGANEIVLKKYLEFIMREPKAYIDIKTHFASKTLGISEKLRYEEYNYNLNEGMGEWGLNDSVERLMFFRKYFAACQLLGDIILRPWIVYVITMVLVGIEWLKKSQNRDVLLFMLFLAIFYYGGYLLNTQSFELRYFYPSLYLMWIVDIMILEKYIIEIGKKIKLQVKRKIDCKTE